MALQDDVKTGQPSSADQDVKQTASSTVPEGVTASAPPAEDKGKQHEQAIPYERFNEKVEEVNRLKAELESLKSQPEEPEAEFNWGFEMKPEPASPPPSAPSPYNADEIEERLSHDIQSKPFSTLWPMMLEAARQQVIAQKKLETQVRSIPDFNQYESDYYSVPDNLIQQAQQNPEIVRYLLAKHRRTLSPKRAQSEPARTSPPSNPSPPTNGPASNPVSMEELAEKYRKEGEARALERINSQRGMTSESTATYSSTTGDEPELDEQGKALMFKLGLSPDRQKKAAQRLESFMKGK